MTYFKNNTPDVNEKGLYVYCIMPKDVVTIHDQKGIDGEGSLFLVQYRELVAVVSEVKLKDFKLSMVAKEMVMEWAEEKVRIHEKIVERLMKENDLLPTSFGSIVSNKEALIDLMTDKYYEYISVLEKLKGKEEWTIKAYLSFEKFKQALEDNTPEIRKRKEILSALSKSDAFLMKRKIDNLVKEQMDIRLENVLLHIVEVLRKVSECEAFSNVEFPKHQKDNSIILKASYLVKKSIFQDFLQQINKLTDELESEGITFEVIGPWPPYSFVED
ncbi:GvpL/GvpF family gas vesicle protein [Marinisporobacter balticus]|nr:GvpL/GvpF family gas vesicle protein [Marinisporobacter balticus]